MSTFDVAVIGGGVIGLAHAYAAARHLGPSGKVVLIERNVYAQGASIRNFGMLWPVGQPVGYRRDVASKSRNIWHGLLTDSGIWHRETGSLHVCYHDDEAQVVQEYLAGVEDEMVRWVDRAECLAMSPQLVQNGLRGGLFSASEMQVDPRVVIREIPRHLANVHGVTLMFGQTAVGISDAGTISLASGETLKVRHTFVCSGHDIRNLYPEILDNAGLIPCKLQMMRTEPLTGFDLGPMLAAGLTLTHYESFSSCPTLPALKARYTKEWPEQLANGIHVLLSQAKTTALTIGDSHEYGDQVMPFSETKVDDLILDYLATFFAVPTKVIAERWTGVYLKNPNGPWLVETPVSNVTVVNGFGGAGMTLSMGVGDVNVRNVLQGLM
ncbi:MAG: TIGR03364 family FAD-dependent oxidoreductase [Armatimonadota bacterium]